MLALGLEDSLKLRQGAASGSKNRAQRYTTKPMSASLHARASASTHNQLLVLTAQESHAANPAAHKPSTAMEARCLDAQHAAHSNGAGKYLNYAANHNTKARKLVHRTVSTITCKHTCSAPVFSTLRWWRYNESHAIPKTLDLRTAQTRRDPSSKKARAESNIPTPDILQGRGGREKQNAHARLC